MKMNARVKVLKQLVADGQYVVDDAAVADAIILRSALLQMVPEVSFRCGSPAVPQVRSFARIAARARFGWRRRSAGRCTGRTTS